MPTALSGFNSITCLYDEGAIPNFPLSTVTFQLCQQSKNVFPVSASRWQLHLIKQDTLKLGERS